MSITSTTSRAGQQQKQQAQQTTDRKPDPSQLLDELSDYVSPSSTKRIEEIRVYFEQLVTAFPLSGRFWKLYIEQEMKEREYERVERLFTRCLIRVRHIELWRSYLHYIRQTKQGLASFREKMGQAYEFALEKVGIDFLSYPIWNEYVQFLKSVQAVGSYAENQKITAVRRVYQRGIVTPMLNIEPFWKDYIDFEKSINLIIAEKIQKDKSRDYMDARRVAKEYEAVTKGLNRNAPALQPTGRSDERRQIELWRRYIQWEISNPLRLEESAAHVKRVTYAYEQCILCLSQHLDIWLEYAGFLEARSRQQSERNDVTGSTKLLEDAAAVYERAIVGPMSGSMLVHFAYADFEESRNRKEKAGEIYQRLLANPNLQDTTLAYIQYIRFARRSEGIKTARFVFKKAREDARTSYQIYTYSALMEYYCSKDKNITCKIFELGLKKYGSNPDYVLSYIDFFMQLNEENNTRVLFERVLSTGALSDEDALPIWDRFLQFEADVGDLQSIQKVEKRRLQLLEKLQLNSKFRCSMQWMQRYRFNDLLPFNSVELRSFRNMPSIHKYAHLFGLSGSGSLLGSNTANGTSAAAAANDAAEKEAADQPEHKFKPDVHQMIPFKPAKLVPPNSHTVPGGIFPPPPAIGQLLSILPHPTSFQGPFVFVDELMVLFRGLQLPDHFRAATPNGGHSVRQFDSAVRASLAMYNDNEISNSPASSTLDTDSGSHPPTGLGNGSLRRRRGAANEDDDEDYADDDNSNSNPSTTRFDIYRKRKMQKRLLQNSSIA